MAISEADIIEAARQRVGNKPEISVAEQFVPDEAILDEMSDYVVECNNVFGSVNGLGKKEVQFSLFQGQQHYSVSDVIGDDVREIKEVLRSDAYISDSFLEPTMVDPRTGVPMARAAFIDKAYQQDVLDETVAMQRWRRTDLYSWERISLNSVDTLRLMPPPTDTGIVVVSYITTGESIDDLPDQAYDALVNAASMAILDCMLNRVNSNPQGTDETTRDRRYWIEMVERQRDRYEARYRRSLTMAPNRS